MGECRVALDELVELMRPFVANVNALEAELGISTAFWYHMIRWIEQMANYADRVGSRLRLLMTSSCSSRCSRMAFSSVRISPRSASIRSRMRSSQP